MGRIVILLATDEADGGGLALHITTTEFHANAKGPNMSANIALSDVQVKHVRDPSPRTLVPTCSWDYFQHVRDPSPRTLEERYQTLSRTLSNPNLNPIIAP